MADKYMLVALVLVFGVQLIAAIKYGDPNTTCQKRLTRDTIKYTTQERTSSTRKVLEDAIKPCNMTTWYITLYKKMGRTLPQECDVNQDPVIIKQLVTKTDYKYHVRQRTKLGSPYCLSRDTVCVKGYELSYDKQMCMRKTTVRRTTRASTTRPTKRPVPSSTTFLWQNWIQTTKKPTGGRGKGGRQREWRNRWNIFG